MPLSSAVRERCRVLFQPDEELRYLFLATSVSLGRGILGMAHFIIAISDTRVTVMSSSWWRRHTPTSVYARYPRAIQLGPMDTSMAPTYAIGSLVLETDEEYDSLIRAADAEISGTDPLPPDPLPEL
jgi:hypothetical protein